MLPVAQFTTAPGEGQGDARRLRLAATPDEFQAWLATWLPWITGAEVARRSTLRAGAAEGGRRVCEFIKFLALQTSA